MVAFLLLSRPQLRVDPIQSSSLPSEVPDPIKTIETSKMTLALEEETNMLSWGFATEGMDRN